MRRSSMIAKLVHGEDYYLCVAVDYFGCEKAKVALYRSPNVGQNYNGFKFTSQIEGIDPQYARSRGTRYRFFRYLETRQNSPYEENGPRSATVVEYGYYCLSLGYFGILIG